MATLDKERLNWGGLELYTKEFKDWILRLFSKAHARMGHIEEEIANVKKNSKVDYQLETTLATETSITYSLTERYTGTNHGNITIKNNTGITVPTWEKGGSGWDTSIG